MESSKNCFVCGNVNIKFICGGTNETLCPHYPAGLPTTKDVVEVYYCEEYEPIVISTSVYNPSKEEKKQSPFIVSQLKSMGFKVTEVPMYDDILRKAVNRAWFLGLCLGSSVGTLLTLIDLLIGGAL